MIRPINRIALIRPILWLLLTLAFSLQPSAFSQPTIPVTWNLTNYTAYPASVSRVQVQPVPPYPQFVDFYGVPENIIFNPGNTPSITNGTVTTNVYTGTLYLITISGPFGVLYKTNFFPNYLTNLSGPFLANQYDLSGFSQWDNLGIGIYFSGTNFLSGISGGSTNAFTNVSITNLSGSIAGLSAVSNGPNLGLTQTNNTNFIAGYAGIAYGGLTVNGPEIVTGNGAFGSGYFANGVTNSGEESISGGIIQPSSSTNSFGNGAWYDDGSGGDIWAKSFTIVGPGNFSGGGAGLANLNASTLASGTVPLARLPSQVVTNNQTNATLGGTFSGNGSGLTNFFSGAPHDWYVSISGNDTNPGNGTNYPFLTITNALTNAYLAGGTNVIHLLSAGIYSIPTNCYLSNNTMISGTDGSAVILYPHTPAGRNGLVIAGDNVTLSGITVDKNDNNGTLNFPIILQKGTNFWMYHCIVSSDSDGLFCCVPNQLSNFFTGTIQESKFFSGFDCGNFDTVGSGIGSQLTFIDSVFTAVLDPAFIYTNGVTAAPHGLRSFISGENGINMLIQGCVFNITNVSTNVTFPSDFGLCIEADNATVTVNNNSYNYGPLCTGIQVGLNFAGELIVQGSLDPKDLQNWFYENGDPVLVNYSSAIYSNVLAIGSFQLQGYNSSNMDYFVDGLGNVTADGTDGGTGFHTTGGAKYSGNGGGLTNLVITVSYPAGTSGFTNGSGGGLALTTNKYTTNQFNTSVMVYLNLTNTAASAVGALYLFQSNGAPRQPIPYSDFSLAGNEPVVISFLLGPGEWFAPTNTVGIYQVKTNEVQLLN